MNRFAYFPFISLTVAIPGPPVLNWSRFGNGYSNRNKIVHETILVLHAFVHLQ